MKYRTRKIIAFFFIAMFAVTAPAVVLHTSGYRYNWKKNRFEKTGIIRVDSSPADADIWLNGVKQKRKTPSSVTKLLPDEYSVRVEKTGFLPWQKTLAVRSNETTFAEDIILFSQGLPRQMRRDDIRTAAFSPDGALAYLRSADDVIEMVVAERTDAEPTLLARFGADEFASTRLTWSPDGAFLEFYGVKADGTPALLIYRPWSEGDPIAVHELLAGKVTAADPGLRSRWSSSGRLMTVVTATGAFLVDAADGSFRTLSSDHDIEDVLATDRIYAVRNEGAESVLEMTVTAGRPLERLAELPPGRYRFIDERAGSLLIADDREKKILMVDAGDGSVLRTFGATGAVREDGGGRLLLWNDFEISVYDPAAQSRSVVTRLGTPILDAAWHPAGKHVIFASATEVTIIELDDRGSKNAYALGRFTALRKFFIDPSGKRIEMIGSVGSQQGVFERDL